MKLIKSLLFLTSALSNTANAEEVIEDKWWHWGWCPQQADPVGDFEVERYMGTWYQIRVDKDNEYMQGLDCVHTKYTYHPSDWWYRLLWVVTVNNSHYKRAEDKLTNWWFLGDLSKALDWTLGSARCDANGNCKVKVFFSEGNY